MDIITSVFFIIKFEIKYSSILTNNKAKYKFRCLVVQLPAHPQPGHKIYVPTVFK